jgi:uncharacterized membrane protein
MEPFPGPRVENRMNGAHLHLIINHAPIFGALFVTILFAVALTRRSQELIRLSMWFVLVVVAAGAATYLTGEGAEDVVRNLPDYDEALVERHETLGKVTVIAAALLGVFTLVVLMRTRGREISRGIAVFVFAVVLLADGLIGFTSMAGGRIRHPEARPGFVTP